MRRRWFSLRAVLLHFGLLLFATGCAIASWWQLSRALGGNGLSWFYTFEWPAFVAIAVAAWWHLIHEEPEERAERLRKREEVEPSNRQAEW